MKTTIYLHIGSCKTGTSYIQNFLDLNRLKLLSDHACLYPNFSSSDFISGRCHNHVQWSLEKINDEQNLLKDIERLIYFCDENQIEKVILSNEGWLNFIRNASNLLKAINEIRNYELIAICYLRRIDHWIESAWKQWGLKEYKTIEEFLEDPDISMRYQLYFKSIETWANIIGEDKIIARPYEKEQLKQGLVFDFLMSVGIDPKSNQWIQPEPSNLARNPGFTQDVLEMLHYSSGLLTHKHDNRLFDLFFELLGDKFQKPPFASYTFLSPTQRIELIERNQIYERRIAKRYMNRPDGKIFLEPLPDSNNTTYTPYEGLNLKKVVPILVKMIDKNNRLIHELKSEIETMGKQIKEFEKSKYNAMDNQQPNKSTSHERQRKSINNLFQPLPKLKFIHHIKEYLFLFQYGQFNRDFYRQHNSDHAFSKCLPMVHYLTTGWKRGKNPTPHFNTNYYLEYNPDVKQSGINPFYHYLRWGKKEGRIPQKTNETTYPFYSRWVENYSKLSSKDIKLIERKITQLEKQPNFLLFLKVLEFDKQKISKSIQGIKAQLYRNWKLIILIPPKEHEDSIHEYLSSVIDKPQILIKKLTSEDPFPSVMDPLISTTNADYLCILDQSVILEPHALYMAANRILEDENVDLIYFDEDRVDENGNRFDPFYKTDWNPDLFKSQNFIGACYVLSINNFKNNSPLISIHNTLDHWHSLLEITNLIDTENICHIPFILFHVQINSHVDSLSTFKQSFNDATSMNQLFKNIEKRFAIISNENTGFQLNYPIPEPEPLVSIIIPTKNQQRLLENCINSINMVTKYSSIEILIVNNQSYEPDSIEYLKKLEKTHHASIITYDHPFNYSAINNLAVQHSKGEILLFLNNDIEVISPYWINELVRQAVRESIGAVGGMLYYPNNTIQHAGVILGLGGVAGHLHRFQPKGFRGQRNSIHFVQNFSAITGACMAIEKKKFLEVGGFDEINLPINYNDIDLCLRLIKAGFRNLWTPHVELTHHESVSRGRLFSNENEESFSMETAYMEKTWGNVIKNDPYFNPNLSLENPDFLLASPPRIKKPWIQ